MFKAPHKAIGVMLVPTSWGLGVWHRGNGGKTIVAIGPVRLVIWRHLGSWKWPGTRAERGLFTIKGGATRDN
jgi:hypothetical protein